MLNRLALTELDRVRSAAARVRARVRSRSITGDAHSDDSGNLVAVLILTVALVAFSAVATQVVYGGFGTAAGAEQGGQAVAQANAGLSDALFRLDQMGDNIASFCIGNPPASLLPGGLKCSPAGTAPLPSAPGLRWYVADQVLPTPSTPLPAGVVNELRITTYAVAGGQSRRVTALIYRVANDYGAFGVAGMDDRGALKQATINEVGGGGNVIAGGTVLVGVGPNGLGTCTGNSTGSEVITVGENGATVTSCPSPVNSPSTLTPTPPGVCGPQQLSTAMAPCIDLYTNSGASNFATSGGSTYCPLPGSGIPNAIPLTTAVTAPPNAVFDCATNGSALTVSTDDPMPFGLTTIPAGSYYFDSNTLTVGDIAPCTQTVTSDCLNSPVSFYALPAACSNVGTMDDALCPLYTPPPSGPNLVETSGGCAAPPNGADVSLTLSGSEINVPAGTSNKGSSSPPPPGYPQNLSLYWSGNTPVSTGATWFDGYLYAPAATMVSNGRTGIAWFGAFVLNCFQQHGGPNLRFSFALHVRDFLAGWSVAAYRITP